MNDRIASAGIYVPLQRLSTADVDVALGNAPTGVDKVAVASADEDALTLGVEAAKRALSRGPYGIEDVRFVGVATTTPPLREEAIAPKLSRMLGIDSTAASRDATQTRLDAGRLLETATMVEGPALVIAADCPKSEPIDGESLYGAGAAAFVLATEGAVQVTGTAHSMDDVSGIQYRQPRSATIESLNVTSYEREAITDCIRKAVDQLPINSDVHSFVGYQPDGDAPYRIASTIGVVREAVQRGTVADVIGDVGAATAPIGLVSALADADSGSETVAGFFASGGGSIALSFEGGLDHSVSPVDAKGQTVSVVEYLRMRGLLGTHDVSGGGAHISEPTWHQHLDERYRLVTSGCSNCGAVTFPSKEVCYSCGADESMEPVTLPTEGRVVAVTTIAQGTSPPEFAPIQERSGDYDVVIVEFDIGGQSVKVPGQVTPEANDALAIGDQVQSTVRRLYVEEGIPRYSVKFRPISTEG